MTSPFYTHREKIVGHYGTAAWLRQVVMSMWHGFEHPVGLGELKGLDEDHYSAFCEMISHYHQSGTNDLALRRLVLEIEDQIAADAQAAALEERFIVWCQAVRTHLREFGSPGHLVDDRATWFQHHFKAGASPYAAALSCVQLSSTEE